MVDRNAKVSYRRAVARIGESVTFVRVIGEAPNTTIVQKTVKAIVRDYTPTRSEAVAGDLGDITLGARHIIVREVDLRIAQFPLPLQKNDKVRVRGELLNVSVAEPLRRSFAGAIDVAAYGV